MNFQLQSLEIILLYEKITIVILTMDQFDNNILLEDILLQKVILKIKNEKDKNILKGA